MFSSLVHRWLPVAALSVTLLAAIDPLEGFPVVLIGGVLTVMAAIQERSRHVTLALVGLVTAVIGCVALVALSAAGGVGPAAGRSWWWLGVIAPYPVGVLVFMTAGVLLLRDRAASRGA